MLWPPKSLLSFQLLLVNLRMMPVLPFPLFSMANSSCYLTLMGIMLELLKNNLVSQNILGFFFSCLLFNSLAVFQKSGTGLRCKPPFTSVGTGHPALRSAGLPSGEGSASFVVSQLPWHSAMPKAMRLHKVSTGYHGVQAAWAFPFSLPNCTKIFKNNNGERTPQWI